MLKCIGNCEVISVWIVSVMCRCVSVPVSDSGYGYSARSTEVVEWRHRPSAQGFAELMVRPCVWFENCTACAVPRASSLALAVMLSQLLVMLRR